MFTRKQYLNKECTFEQYYGQLATESVKKTVLNFFSPEELKAAYAKDKHFNSIPLANWDHIGKRANLRGNLSAEFKKLGDYSTVAGLVCVVKNAARQIINE